ncbi:MAG: four-carbon acid sugar kinase family protein [Bryobacteraceae bacterium]
MALVFAAVADDDTGATDLAGMLADHGVRTVLVIDVPAPADLERWAAGADAVVVGVSTRSVQPRVAYERTRTAIRLLSGFDPRVYQIKYCSTFDSTPEGNIGQSIDAAMDELGESFTIALPALPVNGRTTYMGYHFVYQQLLSDSPMRDHPLTPMRNPHLVSHLAGQTRRRVGLAHYPVTAERIEQARAQGVEIAILDCISDEDLERICEAIADLRLITGSSAPAIKLPTIWRARGWWTRRPASWTTPESGGRGFLVVAGSCSVATRRQNEWLEQSGASVVVVDPVRLAEAAEPPIGRIVDELRAGRTCLVRTASDREDVERVPRWASEGGLSVLEAGARISLELARLVRRVFEAQPPAALVVAGGETAGAVCRALELAALEVRPNIEPGVPLCVSLGWFRLPVVLKSGNFGSPDFYGRALEACRAALQAGNWDG